MYDVFLYSAHTPPVLFFISNKPFFIYHRYQSHVYYFVSSTGNATLHTSLHVPSSNFSPSPQITISTATPAPIFFSVPKYQKKKKTPSHIVFPLFFFSKISLYILNNSISLHFSILPTPLALFSTTLFIVFSTFSYFLFFFRNRRYSCFPPLSFPSTIVLLSIIPLHKPSYFASFQLFTFALLLFPSVYILSASGPHPSLSRPHPFSTSSLRPYHLRHSTNNYPIS